LGDSLRAHGVEILFASHQSFYQDIPPPEELSTFLDAAGFLDLVRRQSPALLVCIQGEGLEFIPERGFDVPILADWIAPRTLEFAFQSLPLEQWLPRLVANVRKADYHSCCSEAQRAYLYFLLQLAGVRLDADTTLVIPLSAAVEFEERPPRSDGPVFVSGGVNWPWIRSDHFLRLLLEEMERAGKGVLKIFGGPYPFRTDASVYQPLTGQLPASTRLQLRGMMPYGELLREYRSADVAVNLFEENPERRLAFSFREIDYLKSGLPLVCAGFSHVSRFVRDLGAGWVLDETGDDAVRKVFREILARPSIPATFGEAAREIIRRHFDQSRTIEPLLRVLEKPRKQAVDSSLIQAAFLWGEQARAELEKVNAEVRTLRAETAGRQRDLDSYRQLEERLKQNLAAAQATIDELRAYIAAKEADLAENLKIFAEKDEALGYQKARLLAAESEIADLKADLQRQTETLEKTCREKAGLESALNNIQSKLMYRIYKKVAGK
jgi:glycosyltransferase involved in cell wall biosynthesis